MYYQAFAKMIDTWRAAFNDPKMPFGIISLCTDGPAQTPENYLEMMVNEGIYIREVQYKTFLDLQAAGDKNIGFALSYAPEVEETAGNGMTIEHSQLNFQLDYHQTF